MDKNLFNWQKTKEMLLSNLEQILFLFLEQHLGVLQKLDELTGGGYFFQVIIFIFIFSKFWPQKQGLKGSEFFSI